MSLFRTFDASDSNNVRVATIDGGEEEVGLLLLGPTGVQFVTHELLAESERRGDTYTFPDVPLEQGSYEYGGSC